MNRRKYFQSRIAAKISRKMLSIYIGIYFLLLIALLLIITPILYRREISSASENLTILKTQYETLLEQIDSSITNLYLADQLNILLDDPAPDTTTVQIEQLLSEYSAKNPNVLATCIENAGGEFFSSYYFSDIDKYHLLHANEHYVRLLDSSAGSYYFPVNSSDFSSENSDYNTIICSQKVLIGKERYLITTIYNATSAIKSGDAINASAFQGYAITNRYDEIIYQSETYRAADTALIEGNTSGSVHTANGMYFYDTSVSSGWIFTGYVPYTQLLSTLFLIMGLITGLYLISPVLYILFLIPVTTNYLEPLSQLSETMSTFTAGQTIRSSIHTRDEIEDVSNSFNQMVEKINQQVTDIQRQERENAVVNYKLLSTQVDPHFVYNTMHVINIAARRGDTDAVIEINSALTRILRERLNSKLDIYDTLQNELNTLQQYEVIMDYRHQNKIYIHYDVETELLQQQIPKNLLQPLIENSFYHGFFTEDSAHGDKTPEGNIDVIIYSLQDEMVIEVSDNGNGMTDERVKQIQNSDSDIYNDQNPHIGIDNIRQRLLYIYGEHHQFEIHSTLGIGTTIVISLPLHQK